MAFQGTWSQERECSQQHRGFIRQGPIPQYLLKVNRAGPGAFHREFTWSGKFMVRLAQGEARKATRWSGSVPVRVTGVRHSPVITGQVYSDKAVLRPCWEFRPQVTAPISGVHGQDRHSHDSAEGLGLSLSRVARGCGWKHHMRTLRSICALRALTAYSVSAGHLPQVWK